MKHLPPLPKSRAARQRLILRDSTNFIRRMGPSEVDKLLFSLSRTDGLSPEESADLNAERFNVPFEFVT